MKSLWNMRNMPECFYYWRCCCMPMEMMLRDYSINKIVMNSSKKYFLLSVFFFSPFVIKAQEGVRNNSEKKEIEGKIMIIPFEPKLYMSEIDQKINQVTKWDFNQIRENFRHQLDAQLKLKLQSTFPVVSFYTDSAKMSKDLEYTYMSTGLSYDLVEKPTSATTAVKKEAGIKNGQIIVEVNNDKKFMNTKLSNTEVLTYLNKKYKTDYFVFVNELDIKNNMDSYNISTDTYQREVSVHYSIIDKAGKTISAGLETSAFSSKENNPKKIISECFSAIATSIASKFSLSITQKSATPKK